MANVTVLGAGVVGLSTARELQDRGYNVTIVAEYQPTDKKSIRYTSPWAGANHFTVAEDDEKQLAMDKRTFLKFWEMSADASTQHLFLRLNEEVFSKEALTKERILDFYPSYEEIAVQTLPSFAKGGERFQTVTIDVPNYLLYLLETFEKKGGKVVSSSVQHISQLLDGAFGTGKPDAVVVCAGIGARSLGGVEDKNVYPQRGQVVLVRAPWIKTGRSAKLPGGPAYIIPRRSGDVIIGGIRDDNDWYPHPLPEVTEGILKRGLELCPELAPTLEDLKALVIEEGCGLRPSRVGGIRLESVHMPNRWGEDVPVVFNYGHGGYGYQSSWGSAYISADLLVASLKGVFTAAKGGADE